MFERITIVTQMGFTLSAIVVVVAVIAP